MDSCYLQSPNRILSFFSTLRKHINLRQIVKKAVKLLQKERLWSKNRKQYEQIQTNPRFLCATFMSTQIYVDTLFVYESHVCSCGNIKHTKSGGKYNNMILMCKLHSRKSKRSRNWWQMFELWVSVPIYTVPHFIALLKEYTVFFIPVIFPPFSPRPSFPLSLFYIACPLIGLFWEAERRENVSRRFEKPIK